MKKFVINLDRSPDRLALFRERNGHVIGIERFPAIDGLDLSSQAVDDSGVVLPGQQLTRGAIGSAMSHMALWRHSVAIDEPVVVIEDDAILSYFFEHHLLELSRFRGVWDYVAWGWNFDAPLHVVPMPGVAAAKITMSQNQLRSNIESFQFGDFPSRLVRLVHHFGILCYSVTPRGARRLLEQCRPIKPGHRTIDASMGDVYRTLEAYVSFPPTAVSENRHETSTIVERP